jgi:uncharacterized membrane protein
VHSARSRAAGAGQPLDLKWRPITMLAIIALVLVAIVALTVLSFAVHLLFSPLLLVAIAVVAWLKFRPRRSHQ